MSGQQNQASGQQYQASGQPDKPETPEKRPDQQQPYGDANRGLGAAWLGLFGEDESDAAGAEADDLGVDQSTPPSEGQVPPPLDPFVGEAFPTDLADELGPVDELFRELEELCDEGLEGFPDRDGSPEEGGGFSPFDGLFDDPP